LIDTRATGCITDRIIKIINARALLLKLRTVMLVALNRVGKVRLTSVVLNFEKCLAKFKREIYTIKILFNDSVNNSSIHVSNIISVNNSSIHVSLLVLLCTTS
jgi:hypothetical protein